MRVVSFNVNSVRVRIPQLRALIERHHPEIIGLQETKVTDECFPVEAIKELGYHAQFYGQKTHYGVALLSKQTPTATARGFHHDEEDSQRRFIECSYSLADGRKLSVINGYFPQGSHRDHPTKFPAKKKFYVDQNKIKWTYKDSLNIYAYELNRKTLVLSKMNIMKTKTYN